MAAFVSRALKRYSLIPPPQLPSRITRVAPHDTIIDNEFYHHDQSWHTQEDLATLHRLNSARIPFFDNTFRQQLDLTPSRKGAFLEIGCGGGIVSVALAKLGYRMTAIDPATKALEQARSHARGHGVADKTVFQEATAYDLSAFPDSSFSGVVMADVLEHLLDLPTAMQQVRRVLKPGGVLVFDTINRTYRSYIGAIVLAQDVFKLVPPNCHDWRLFIKPEELSFLLQSQGFLTDSSLFRGMAPSVSQDPLHILSELRAFPQRLPRPPIGDFHEVSSLAINYMGWAALPLGSESSSEDSELQKK